MAKIKTFPQSSHLSFHELCDRAFDPQTGEPVENEALRGDLVHRLHHMTFESDMVDVMAQVTIHFADYIRKMRDKKFGQRRNWPKVENKEKILQEGFHAAWDLGGLQDEYDVPPPTITYADMSDVYKTIIMNDKEVHIPAAADFSSKNNAIRLSNELKTATLEKKVSCVLHEGGHGIVNAIAQRQIYYSKPLDYSQCVRWHYQNTISNTDAFYWDCSEEGIVRMMGAMGAELISPDSAEADDAYTWQMDGLGSPGYAKMASAEQFFATLSVQRHLDTSSFILASKRASERNRRRSGLYHG